MKLQSKDAGVDSGELEEVVDEHRERLSPDDLAQANIRWGLAQVLFVASTFACIGA